MGEDTTDPAEVAEAVREFINLVSATTASGLRASIALNLSHIGLAIDRELARAHCVEITSAAGAAGIEVILNAEGDAYRDHVLDTYAEVGPALPGLGITLQGCLERTSDDLARCLELPRRIRLVKGAYDEMERLTGIRGPAVNQRYDRLAAQLLLSDHPCAIATHDPERLRGAVETLRHRTHGAAEFEMLLGVARDRLDQLKQQGFGTRVYVPYGEDWFLYLCHRVAEYPGNLARAVAVMAGRFQKSVAAPGLSVEQRS
jgi:proline dehydrogenase